MTTAARRTPETIQKNIQRLISRCQDLVDTKQTEVRVKVPLWKLKTYVSVLDGWIAELDAAAEEKASGVDEDLMKTLRPRRDILKQLVENKVKAAVDPEGQDGAAAGPLLRQVSLEDALPSVELPRPSAREELLRMSSVATGDHNLVHRHTGGVESDIEQVMQKHRELQDQIAEDMLQSVSVLKQNSLAARSTIEKDSEVLEHASSEADKNIDKLEQETDRLGEHRRNSCPWTVWIMLIIVFIVFFLMVLFIKITSYI